MFATLPRLSKASRRALTPKRGNKDYYKGASPGFSDATTVLMRSFVTQGRGRLCSLEVSAQVHLDTTL